VTIVKLEWKEDRLCLGGWVLATVRHDGDKCDEGGCVDYIVHTMPCTVSKPYEEAMGAAQDCESAVRELLKKEGVRLE
jgi:hypothetical protein